MRNNLNKHGLFSYRLLPEQDRAQPVQPVQLSQDRKICILSKDKLFDVMLVLMSLETGCHLISESNSHLRGNSCIENITCTSSLALVQVISYRLVQVERSTCTGSYRLTCDKDSIVKS